MVKIFISYRRNDSKEFVGRVYDRLRKKFKSNNVFIDFNSVQYGENFPNRIKKSLMSSDITLVIIGKEWEKEIGKGNSSTDYVKYEIEKSLDNNIPILPLLISDAKMPSASALPDSLKDISMINAIPIRSGKDFEKDIYELITYIQQKYNRKNKRNITLVIIFSLFFIFSFEKLNIFDIESDFLRSNDVGNIKFSMEINKNDDIALAKMFFRKWKNNKKEGLVKWHDKGDFLLIGIGNFPWFPKDKNPEKKQVALLLFDYMKLKGVKLPDWLIKLKKRGLPWKVKSEFLVKDKEIVTLLEDFLYRTLDYQMQYILEEYNKALDKMINSTSKENKITAVKNLNDTSKTLQGKYLIIDYIRKYGLGIEKNISQKNYGLLQVILDMKLSPNQNMALKNFQLSAVKISRSVATSKRSDDTFITAN